MEGSSALSFFSSKFHNNLDSFSIFTAFRPSQTIRFYPKRIKSCLWAKRNIFLSSVRSSLTSPASAVTEALEKASVSVSSLKETFPKIDKSGRFCSPRAARELALLILYAACLEGSDPVRLLEKRLNARREPGYEFNKALLLEYNHMSFSGPPLSTETEEMAEEHLRKNEKESAIEAEVLSAPPKLVYSKLILRFTKKLLVAVTERWDKNVLVIDSIAPPNWKKEPAARILELCILHLAMGEITVIGTQHQIVINEAIDLAKRFCDGTAPRIINGCMRTFVKDHIETNISQPLKGRS
ncbi:transcription antitermination protein NusB [Telopea speciosissima]|uniref:transcription antitermination protein NusB n=1 Tax=Telopea speciosissima TaxID=54955 RepID=UPI001CC56D87|nr:transcription antitermination protein NusB [Telopea speciosissima]